MIYFIKNLFLLILFSVSISFSFAQKISFPENQGQDGLNIESSDNNGITLKFALSEFSFQSTKIEGESMQQLVYGLSLVPGKEGAPNLPFIGKNILIPDGSQIEVELISADKEIFHNINIAPAAKIPFDTEETIPAVKGIEYSKNEWYPQNNITFKTTEIRGMQFASLRFSPFQYNAVSKELVVYKNMEFEIKFNSKNTSYGQERFRSPFWDQILSDLVYNEQDIPEIDYNLRNTNQSKEAGCEYLIVTPNQEEFLAWADSIKQFRNAQGVYTKIVTIDEIGGNDVNVLDTYFTEVYNTWDPVPSAVLLMADYGDDDHTITSKRFPHPYEGTYISDNYYADVTGNNLPDFVFARMTARNNEELEIMVGKFMKYELNPPTLASFYNEPITALGWQTERWFQLCTETVGGYMANVLGKTPNRINAIYDGNPMVDPWSSANGTYSITSYFGPNGLNYIPSSPSELDGWSGGTGSDVVDALNAGSFILQHRDHGGYGGWGEPNFNSGSISQLNNSEYLSHIFSINCLTGQFDEGNQCFAEKFHRWDNGGALSITAASQVSYSFVNDAYVWGMYDNMWPDFMPDYGGNLIPERDFRPAFGSASGKYFLSTTSWVGGSMNTITYRLFHHHGDAFNVVYTEIPQQNEVNYEIAITNDITTIAFEAEPYSLVGLSVEGEYLANGITNENGEVSIDYTPQNPQTIIKVVITKQNYFRHQGEILLVVAEGPYLINTNHDNDDANDNGIIEYNEEVYLDFAIKNVGVEATTNVVVSLNTNDEYITIDDATESFGDISEGEEISIDHAFQFTTSVDIPDEHRIMLTYTISNGSQEWNGEFSLIAYAPQIEFSLISFEEIDGNDNGYLDPGETAMASFTISNIGHFDFPAGNSNLTANSSYITIDASEQNFDAIAIGESFVSEFQITTSASTPTGTTASITNNIIADPFSFEKDQFFNIGLIVEDWEMESFDKFDWGFGGDAPWEIATNYVSEGNFSVMIDGLADNEHSSLILDYDLPGNHEISFFIQVSCQKSHDFLSFYIDDELIEQWSGLILFEQYTFPVSAGEHTFKWEYAKDNEGDTGLDAAWLDFIILPPGQTITGASERNKLSLSEFTIYPNPNNGIFQIDYSRLENAQRLSVYSSVGQLVYEKPLNNKDLKQEMIDLSHLNKGLYIIQILDQENASKTQKLMIE